MNNIFKNENGYTLTEMLIVLAFLASAIVGIGGVYAVCHFIAKYW